MTGVELEEVRMGKRMLWVSRLAAVLALTMAPIVAKAADAAVQEAAKTVRDISGAQVMSMSAEVDGDHISLYRTTVNIAFGVERS